jgi:hypothetical protein
MMILKTSRSNLSSNDQLSLDLPFAATKSLTARVGPTPTFTRASAATYYGPLVDYANIAFSTTGVSNGRASWFKSHVGEDITISYTGARWRIHTISGEFESEFLAAVGSEWRPDQANWSASGAFSPVTTSSTFGIVRAATNEPRFDHTSDGVCRGLLIEESRTNICLQSENFGTTWSNDTGSIAIIIDQTTSPSGLVDADKISENTTVSNRRIAIQGASFVSGTTYTFSCFVKAAERDFVQLRFGGAFGGQFQNFVIGGVNAGTIGSGVGATAAIQAYPNGWYRCSITATSATTGSSQVTIGPQVSSTALAWQPYIGTIGSGIFVWGAQNEAGSFATSYIPTVASSVVRSADVCSITGGNFTGMWNQSEGTLLAQTQKTSTNSNAFVISVSDNSFNNEIDLRYNSVSQVATLMNVSNVNQLSGLQANITSGSAVKQSIAYKLNDCAYVANGASLISDTSALIPTVDRLTIGNVAVVGQAFYLNGHLASIRYYRKRLPNAKLQSLTA